MSICLRLCFALLVTSVVVAVVVFVCAVFVFRACSSCFLFVVGVSSVIGRIGFKQARFVFNNS